MGQGVARMLARNNINSINISIRPTISSLRSNFGTSQIWAKNCFSCSFKSHGARQSKRNALEPAIYFLDSPSTLLAVLGANQKV
jgi:hypothetical protein